MPEALETGETAALFVRVLVALGAGFLIGLERGWRQRDEKSGDRAAGVRTYAFYGLFGGLAGVAPGDWTLPAALIGGALLVAAGYLVSVRDEGADRGMTSEAAALVTLLLGGLAGRGELLVATIGAVVTALLLDLKRPLHAFLGLIRHDEVAAALKLLALSVLVLPFLPDKDFGPDGALNLYGIWWAVVLVAGLSFAGYIAIRIFGVTRGPLVFGLVGGLASSTAVTVTASRLARADSAHVNPFAGAIGLAGAVMMVRVAVFTALIARGLLAALWLPLAAGAAVIAVAAGAVALTARGAEVTDFAIEPPRDFWFAVVFGCVMAAIGVGVVYGERWFGHAGLYAIAILSGPFDVDAFTLSAARGAGSTIALQPAADAILLAVAVNTLGKAVIAFALGGAALGVRTALISGLAVAAGAAAWALS